MAGICLKALAIAIIASVGIRGNRKRFGIVLNGCDRVVACCRERGDAETERQDKRKKQRGETFESLHFIFLLNKFVPGACITLQLSTLHKE